jgi:hypothetical protein
MMKYYAKTSDGSYLGAFDENCPSAPTSETEVPAPPTDSTHTWNGSIWIRDLDIEKSKRKQEISEKTGYLISVGYITHNSHNYGTASHSQFNFEYLRNHPANFTWPYNVTTYERYKHAITQAECSDICDLIEASVTSEISAGLDLMDQVHNAADLAALDAIVDTR